MTQSITKNSKKGFTLVELVVVIAILAILAAIAIPVVNSIINTAAKNGALSDAQTIELAIKNCQADIASKTTDVYNGQGGIPNAATQHATIAVSHVATVNAIDDAFDQVTYNGNDYRVFWDTVADKCVFLTGAAGSQTDLDGNAAPGSVTPLSVANAAGDAQVPDAAVMIDNL